MPTIKNPWLNPIKPRRIHAKRQVVEPDGLLSAQELADRVCAHFHHQYIAHLGVNEQVS